MLKLYTFDGRAIRRTIGLVWEYKFEGEPFKEDSPDEGLTDAVSYKTVEIDESENHGI